MDRNRQNARGESSASRVVLRSNGCSHTQQQESSQASDSMDDHHHCLLLVSRTNVWVGQTRPGSVAPVLRGKVSCVLQSIELHALSTGHFGETRRETNVALRVLRPTQDLGPRRSTGPPNASASFFFFHQKRSFALSWRSGLCHHCPGCRRRRQAQVHPALSSSCSPPRFLLFFFCLGPRPHNSRHGCVHGPCCRPWPHATALFFPPCRGCRRCRLVHFLLLRRRNPLRPTGCCRAHHLCPSRGQKTRRRLQQSQRVGTFCGSQRSGNCNRSSSDLHRLWIWICC